MERTFSFRCDDKTKKELDFIKASLNSNQSQAIKDAIHAFYTILKTREQEQRLPQDLLRESGFIGSFEAKRDLSVTYKQEVSQRLRAKHGSK